MQELLYEKDFSTAFGRILGKANISCYQISQFCHIDEAYLSRLRNGTKNNPSPATLVKISLALVHCSDRITLHDIECLFNSVGRSIRIN